MMNQYHGRNVPVEMNQNESDSLIRSSCREGLAVDSCESSVGLSLSAPSGRLLLCVPAAAQLWPYSFVDFEIRSQSFTAQREGTRQRRGVFAGLCSGQNDTPPPTHTYIYS